MAETSASRAGKDAARNYRKLMDDELARIAGTTPTLLLHSCCAPCSTSVIAALSAYFRITVYYYNPNIDEEAEYRKRAREQERLLQILKTPNPVSFLEGDYVPEDFLAGARPRADDAEGGERCTYCYALRLERTAREAQARGFNYFTTTLSVSPMKDAERINKIGGAAAEKYGVKWLWSDFKKKDGYKKSIEMSKEYGLYRQNYCGCSYSRRAGDHESS